MKDLFKFFFFLGGWLWCMDVLHAQTTPAPNLVTVGSPTLAMPFYSCDVVYQGEFTAVNKKRAQRTLANFGYYTGAIDGLWGAKSRLAARMFVWDYYGTKLKNQGKFDREVIHYLNMGMKSVLCPNEEAEIVAYAPGNEAVHTVDLHVPLDPGNDTTLTFFDEFKGVYYKVTTNSSKQGMARANEFMRETFGTDANTVYWTYVTPAKIDTVSTELYAGSGWKFNDSIVSLDYNRATTFAQKGESRVEVSTATDWMKYSFQRDQRLEGWYNTNIQANFEKMISQKFAVNASVSANRLLNPMAYLEDKPRGYKMGPLSGNSVTLGGRMQFGTESMGVSVLATIGALQFKELDKERLEREKLAVISKLTVRAHKGHLYSEAVAEATPFTWSVAGKTGFWGYVIPQNDQWVLSTDLGFEMSNSRGYKGMVCGTGMAKLEYFFKGTHVGNTRLFFSTQFRQDLKPTVKSNPFRALDCTIGASFRF